MVGVSNGLEAETGVERLCGHARWDGDDIDAALSAPAITAATGNKMSPTVNHSERFCDKPSWVHAGRKPQGITMVAAIARVLARVSGVDTETETLKLLAIFSLTGLLLCVIAARYGLDTSCAFF